MDITTMNKGFVIFCKNSSRKDFVKCAYLLALSLHFNNPDEKISIITDAIVPDVMKKEFDQIIPIPWNVETNLSYFAVEQRWKIYHVSPYDETIVLDADMMILDSVDNLWEAFKNHEVCYASQVFTYRQEKINDEYYRKAFVANELPNLYSALHYFKKGSQAQEWYTWLELICKNPDDFYNEFITVSRPRIPSMDVNAGIVSKILDNEDQVTTTNPVVSFTHMKAFVQGWEYPTEPWSDHVGAYIDDECQLKVGNFQQRGIFHYTEPDFVTDKIINKYIVGLGK